MSGLQPGAFSDDFVQCPGQQVAKPRIDVAKGRLAGFQAQHARHYGAIYLPTDAPDQLFRPLNGRGDENVAGRSADDLAQVVRLDLPPYGPYVRVERTYGYDDLGTQPQFFSPFGRQPPCGHVGSVCVAVQALRQSVEQGVEGFEEIIGRKAAEPFVPQRLMACRTTAALHLAHVAAARQQERDPVAMFYPGESGFPHGVVAAQDVP